MTVITPGTVPDDTVFYTGACDRCGCVIRATSWECSLLNLLVLPPQRRHECPTCGSQITMTDGKPTRVRVIVNGKQTEVDSPVTYEALVSHAGLTGSPSATYRRAAGCREGILDAGRKVHAIDGTIFDVIHTGAA